MKILYTHFHTDHGSGPTAYILSLAESLAGHHDIWIAAPKSSDLHQLAKKIPDVHAIGMNFPGRPKAWRGILGAWQAMKALLSTEKFDVVHVNGSSDHRTVMYATIGMGRTRPRIVLTVHALAPSRRKTSQAVRARHAIDHVIAASRHTGKVLCDTSCKQHDVSIIANGVDVVSFHPLDAVSRQRARLCVVGTDHAHCVILGSVAGAADDQGWITAVQALALVPAPIRNGMHILIFGTPVQAWQRQQVDALGMSEHVTFSGQLHDIRSCIAAMDIGLVLPHTGDSLSWACRQMMSMGKPVIVSDYADLPEHVTEGQDGWIVPTRDAAALSRLLIDIVPHTHKIDAMGQNARQKAEQDFDTQMLSKKTLQVYQRLVGSQDRHAAP